MGRQRKWHSGSWFTTAAMVLFTVVPMVAQAVGITRVLPSGPVAAVEQVQLWAERDAVAAGNAQAPAPAQVQCTPAVQGAGIWNSPREWVWTPSAPIAAGTRCQVLPSRSFQALDGTRLQGASSYVFEVSGPAVVEQWPQSYERADEEQVFLLQFNAAPALPSLQAQASCRMDGVGERIGVVLLPEAQKQAVVQALGLQQQVQAAPDHWVALSCARRLSPGAAMQLVLGAQLQTTSGVRMGKVQMLDYEVRPPFTAEWRCQRSHAQAGCQPLGDIRLQWSAPLRVEDARQFVLEHAGHRVSAQLDPEEGQSPQTLRFAGPWTPEASYQLSGPRQVQDDAGRPLSNAQSLWSQPVRIGGVPPLAKFAAAPFGILERRADREAEAAILPMTLRAVSHGQSVQARSLHLSSDVDMMRWWSLVQRYDDGSVRREQAQQDGVRQLPKVVDEEDTHYIATRTVSLLTSQSQAKPLQLPVAADRQGLDAEVIGIPLPQPGLHVVEVGSEPLGEALLDPRLGKPRPMFVRTAALVTNLAVHWKLGQHDAAIWVTSLDQGRPVADAAVQVMGCDGKVVAQARTDAQGLALLPGLPSEAPDCEAHAGSSAWFASARWRDGGVEDMAFAWSNWQRGIESWRFNVGSVWQEHPDWVAHSVLDRSLVRAGQIVSMKHMVRRQSKDGLSVPTSWPKTVEIMHEATRQSYRQPLQWHPGQDGNQHAWSQFELPPAAKLGQYVVMLEWPEDGERGTWSVQSGSFRVEAFRLPVLQGQIQPAQAGTLIQPGVLPVKVALNYLNGGPASGQEVQVSAMLQPRALEWSRWEGYQFRAPQTRTEGQRADEGLGGEEGGSASQLLADKIAIKLDAQGQGQLDLPTIPTLQAPQDLVLEARFSDPNGEVQTLRSTHTVWPAAVQAGVRSEGWMQAGRSMRMQALAVNAQGEPVVGARLKVQAVQHHMSTTRKRLVGGFYSYDNQRSSQDLGQICSGKSDARGMLLCEVKNLLPGEVELIVTAEDAQGHASQAADTVWVSGHGELWFGGQDHDRMDVLADKERYAVGETVELQVRMPFREATALVSVEREGILHTEVMQLRGKDPRIALQVREGWGPNVYISVMAVRGRLYEVPWYSFFTWGYQTPRRWWDAYWHGNKEVVAPTALVDLSKPAFRLGVAHIQVQDPAQRLNIQVRADRQRYQVREQAKVTITGKLADGHPAAGAHVAVAAVDQALLELMPNTSWDVYAGLWQRRGWQVETATAQMEVVGRRHYGRKAVAPGGGGGGGAPTRELLDTLLLWKPDIVLDAQGQAQVEVPLNDALTRFAIVAIAEHGVQRVGTGQTEIETGQDLQIISGLPPVVREGDQFTAMVTVRNTTGQAMQVHVQPQVPGMQLPGRDVALAAGQSQQLQWQVQVPQAQEASAMGQLLWQLQARDSKTGAQDALRITQKVLPAVPVQVQQAGLVQVDGQWRLPLQWPPQALHDRGGIELHMSRQFMDPVHGLASLRAWWQAYPFSCLEQTVGKAVGLGDAQLWQRTMQALPTYLDSDGLAQYFPVTEGRSPQGSDSLTAHLLSVHTALRQQGVDWVWPEVQAAAMESALIAFVQGRIQRNPWSPQRDLSLRKIAAVAALAERGKAQPSMLDGVVPDLQGWPTHALIDWLRVLQHMRGMPQRNQQLQAVHEALLQRLQFQGTRVQLGSSAHNAWWWLMHSADSNVARLLLATMRDAQWDEVRPRLAMGLLDRQHQGHWGTTSANTWAQLALTAFSQAQDTQEVDGVTQARLGDVRGQVQWAQVPEQSSLASLSAPVQIQQTPEAAASDQAQASALTLARGKAAAQELVVTHQGRGQPWLQWQATAAVPRTQAIQAGLQLQKTVTDLQGQPVQRWQRGDIVQVHLKLRSAQSMMWVAINDPIPAGGTILGSGLGRDSVVETRAARQAESISPTFVERAQDGMRAYWEYLPEGETALYYTVRLNNAGQFQLPVTRAEALYAPEVFAEVPNAVWKVEATPAP